MYYYYACGENVPEVRFDTCNAAWDFVYNHTHYDCVVESHY